MSGKTTHVQSKCEELLCEVMDIRNQMVRFAYAPTTPSDQQDAENLVDDRSALNTSFDKLDLYMSKNSFPFLTGDSPTAPDFHLWEMMDQLDGLCKFYNLPVPFSGPGKRRHLYQMKLKLQSLPNIRPYVDSELCKIPYNNPYARFGSNPGTLGQYQSDMVTPWKNKGIVHIVRKRTQVSGQKHKS